ncbi:MAG: hypothetical protein J6X49_07180 [Victivallales bacterium]|nr:hypothetical protein [Victivallales bacterium]
MRPWVEKLIELQEIDLQVARLEQQLAELPKRQAEAELQYKAEADAYAAAEDELKKAEVAMRGIETEISAMSTKKRDFQSKTISIKSNDEYRAAILQIEMIDREIANLEEKQIAAMITIDQLREKKAAKEKELTAGKARAKIVLADLDARKVALENQITEQNAGRPAVVADLEAIGKADAEAGVERTNYLASYNRLRSSKTHSKTVGCVARLEDMACGRCHMNVTYQLKNETNNGKLVFCPSCGAILYVDD